MTLFIESNALLFAIALPVLTLAAMNLVLALGGERGTLLLPSAGPVEMVRRAANRLPFATSPVRAEAPANEPDIRRIA
jgi:hypothetical protein